MAWNVFKNIFQWSLQSFKFSPSVLLILLFCSIYFILLKIMSMTMRRNWKRSWNRRFHLFVIRSSLPNPIFTLKKRNNWTIKLQSYMLITTRMIWILMPLSPNYPQWSVVVLLKWVTFLNCWPTLFLMNVNILDLIVKSPSRNSLFSLVVWSKIPFFPSQKYIMPSRFLPTAWTLRRIQQQIETTICLPLKLWKSVIPFFLPINKIMRTSFPVWNWMNSILNMSINFVLQLKEVNSLLLRVLPPLLLAQLLDLIRLLPIIHTCTLLWIPLTPLMSMFLPIHLMIPSRIHLNWRPNPIPWTLKRRSGILTRVIPLKMTMILCLFRAVLMRKRVLLKASILRVQNLFPRRVRCLEQTHKQRWLR